MKAPVSSAIFLNPDIVLATRVQAGRYVDGRSCRKWLAWLLGQNPDSKIIMYSGLGWYGAPDGVLLEAVRLMDAEKIIGFKNDNTVPPFVPDPPLRECVAMGLLWKSIRAWLDAHPETERFVILDGDDMGPLSAHQVECDGRLGLQEHLALDADRILKGGESRRSMMRRIRFRINRIMNPEHTL